jgi:hypothetical protein
MTPFAAIEHLRSISYDQSGAPFYFYQSINGLTQLVSHTSIVNEPVYQTYFDSRQFSSDPNTTTDYIERATRILSCSSNIKLSKLEQSKRGAYTSENYSLDYTTKTYKQNIYTYDPEKTESLEESTTLSDKFVFSNGIDTPVQGAKDFTSAHIEYIPINSGAYLDGVKSTEDSGQLYTDLTEKAIAKLKTYRSLSNNTSHDLRLHGDLQLNPGRVIQLLFPKALDPDILKEYLETDDTDVYDKTLSGKYFIAAVEHTFEGGEYYVNCRVKRDSRANEIE